MPSTATGPLPDIRDGRAFIVGGGSPIVEFGRSSRGQLSEGWGINNWEKSCGLQLERGVGKRGLMGKGWLGNYLKNDIGTLGGFYTRATGMNDSDKVAGYSQNAGGCQPGLSLEKVRGMIPLTDSGRLAGFTDSIASRINNRGVVAGYSLRNGSNYNHTARPACGGKAYSGTQKEKHHGDSGIRFIQRGVTESMIPGQLSGCIGRRNTKLPGFHLGCRQ